MGVIDLLVFLKKGEDMVMQAITNLLVWAHLLSPAVEPVVAPAKPVVAPIAVQVPQVTQEPKPIMDQAPQVVVDFKEEPKAAGEVLQVVEEKKVSVSQGKPHAPKIVHTHSAPKATQPAVQKKDKGPKIVVSSRLKACLWHINKAWPKRSWSSRYADLVRRLSKKRLKERSERLNRVIQECLDCIAGQKSDKVTRAMYADLELCKRELMQAKGLALFLKANKIKNR